MSFLDPTSIIAILIALSIHEWAHGFAADKLGDPTARYEGRLTINPIAHLDPLGTMMFLMVGFGWGKPVPIDPRYFSHPKRDVAITAIAGPVSNLIIAFIAFFGILALQVNGGMTISSLLASPQTDSVAIAFLAQLFRRSIFINLALMAFNLLPIAPLDGSKVLHMFIPPQHEHAYHEFMRRGPLFLLLLIVLERTINFPLLYGWITMIMAPVLMTMETIARLF